MRDASEWVVRNEACHSGVLSRRRCVSVVAVLNVATKHSRDGNIRSMSCTRREFSVTRKKESDSPHASLDGVMTCHQKNLEVGNTFNSKI